MLIDEAVRGKTKASVHLDAVRGAAALIVMMGHARELFFPSLTARNETASAPIPHLTSLTEVTPPPRIQPTIGTETVMIFFVLSGYLVGGSILKNVRKSTWSWEDYLLKRLTRLWVVLLPALLLVCLCDHVGLRLFPNSDSIYAGPHGQEIVTSGLLNTLGFGTMAGNALFLQRIVTGLYGTDIALWSLANEFWYYMAFPLLVLAVVSHANTWVRLAYLVAGCAICVAVGHGILVLFPIWILGALVALIPLRFPRWVATPLAIFFACLLPMSLVLLRRGSFSATVSEYLVAGIFAALLYLVLHQTEAATASLYTHVASFFSRISYTLYIVHLPIVVMLCAILNRPWHYWPRNPVHLIYFLGVVMFTIGFAYLFYLLFEANTDKIRKSLTRRFARTREATVSPP